MLEHIRRGGALLALFACCAALHVRAAPDDGALALAIRANNVAAAQAALRQGADPDQRLDYAAVPLSWAADTQNPAMVAALLDGGANPDRADIDGVTPLMLACELGDAGIVTQLLDARADVRAARPDGTTPLEICARFGPPDAVARILASGAAADRRDARGQTALMWAAASGRVEAIAPLLRAGADANRISGAGFSPLFFAIKSGSTAAVKALLAAGADTGYRGPENTSAAQLALYQRNFGAALLLVARGADLAERDRTGKQLLHGAAEAGDPALVSLLLEKGADPNGLTGPSTITWVTEANFGQPPPAVPPTPPLLLAAANGHVEAMTRLLAAGADPHFVAQDGTNVALAAAQSGSPAALALALTIAPDANVANVNGATPFHLLIGGGVQPELATMLRLLAAHGGRTDIPDKRGTTAAAIALTGLSEVKAIFLDVFPDTKIVKLADRGGTSAASGSRASETRTPNNARSDLP